MSWSARIVAVDAKHCADACTICIYKGSCHIPKIQEPIRELLTSVDIGCDGHMSVGHAELRCDSFQGAGKDPDAEVFDTDNANTDIDPAPGD